MKLKIKNAINSGIEKNFKSTLTAQQLEFLLGNDEKVKKIREEFEILVSNRKTELPNFFTQEIDDLKF